jgi:hypothetical protein
MEVTIGQQNYYVFENGVGRNTTVYVKKNNLKDYLKKGLTKNYIPQGNGVFLYKIAPIKRRGVRKTPTEKAPNRSNKNLTERLKKRLSGGLKK